MLCLTRTVVDRAVARQGGVRCTALCAHWLGVGTTVKHAEDIEALAQAMSGQPHKNIHSCHAVSVLELRAVGFEAEKAQNGVSGTENCMERVIRLGKGWTRGERVVVSLEAAATLPFPSSLV